jgi:hypothetical protein
VKRFALVYAIICLVYGVAEASLWALVPLSLVAASLGLHHAPRWVLLCLAAVLLGTAWLYLLRTAIVAVVRAARGPLPDSFTVWHAASALVSLGLMLSALLMDGSWHFVEGLPRSSLR